MAGLRDHEGSAGPRPHRSGRSAALHRHRPVRRARGRSRESAGDRTRGHIQSVSVCSCVAALHADAHDIRVADLRGNFCQRHWTQLHEAGGDGAERRPRVTGDLLERGGMAFIDVAIRGGVRTSRWRHAVWLCRSGFGVCGGVRVHGDLLRGDGVDPSRGATSRSAGSLGRREPPNGTAIRME